MLGRRVGSQGHLADSLLENLLSVIATFATLGSDTKLRTDFLH